jgi:dynein heavy chain
MFNLRDLANVVQGLMRAKPLYVSTAQVFQRLWLHENLRVYGDRLVSDEDRKQLQEVIGGTMKKRFGGDTPIEDMFSGPQLFADWLRGQVPEAERVYEELTDYEKARKVLDDYLEESHFSRRAVRPDSLLRCGHPARGEDIAHPAAAARAHGPRWRRGDGQAHARTLCRVRQRL